MVLKSVLFLCRFEGILKIQNLGCTDLRDWAVKRLMKFLLDKWRIKHMGGKQP